MYVHFTTPSHLKEEGVKMDNEFKRMVDRATELSDLWSIAKDIKDEDGEEYVAKCCS
jgi:hypothetical protein